MKRLIVIEGFDRSGKDTLMKDLNLINDKLPNTYIYFNDLEGLPKYDKEQDEFLVWLNKLIQIQINQINKLFETFDNVIMTRFIVSDEVYSTLFNREHTVIKYLDQLRKDINIINYCLLFESFNDYFRRLEILSANLIIPKVQYEEKDLNKINNLYKDNLYKYKGSYLNFIQYDTSKKEILDDFLKYVYKQEL